MHVSLISVLVSLLYSVIPVPNSIEIKDVVFDKSCRENIFYRIDKKFPAEAYEIRIKNKRIMIGYSDDAGRFYAEKTLEQILDDDVVYCGVIKDAPRFEWRGFMLDESRHFFGKEKVKQIIDMMARYKLNRLHWHLSDSEGWRVEIKAYPALCTIGAVGCYSDRKAPARFYTQDDIREIVEYAEKHHIEIIPEIDVPGHAWALIKSVPEIDGKRGTVNPGSEKTYEVLATIFKELSGLFKGRYLHIGGDEVQNQDWNKLPGVQALMHKENLKDLSEVQGYFGRRMVEIIKACGKEVIAWDDLLDSGTGPDGVILNWWRNRLPQYLENGLAKGFRMIICPYLPFYLDYRQSPEDKHGWVKERISALKDIYEFKFEDNPLIIGPQANLWTELISTEKRLDYMMYPRLLALAELAWTNPEAKNYDDFLRRLNDEYLFMDSHGLYYYDMRNPARHPEPSYKN